MASRKPIPAPKKAPKKTAKTTATKKTAIKKRATKKTAKYRKPATPVRAKKPSTPAASKARPTRSAAKAVEPIGQVPPLRVPEPEVYDLFERDLRKRGPDTVPQSGDMWGKYVYCIIRSGEPLEFGALGIGPEPGNVYTVSYRDLAAVISDAPIGMLDPTRENVLAHQRVNETVMREHTVLPMSFGTVFKTREDIFELLRSAHGAFDDVLSKMQDKVEFGLKILWDRDQIVRQIEDEEEDIRRVKGEILSQKGSTYFARMQYGRMIEAALAARSDRYVAEIFHELRDVAVASRSNKPIGDKMIMNAAFLVSRDRENAFDSKVKGIGARYDSLHFKYTGPWPPYNFVNIRLKLERAQ